MKTFRKFPSIIQFAGIVKNVRDNCTFHNLPLPTLTFSGSTKLHGSNGAIGFSPDGTVWFQSRERLLSWGSDNAGFCTWGEANMSSLKQVYSIISSDQQLDHTELYIYGEWCGPGIQKSVALSQLNEKKFAIFEIILVDSTGNTISINPVQYHQQINSLLSNVFVVDAIVPPLEMVIDFNNPSAVQNRLLELTLEVEKLCPVGAYVDITEGCTIGEGIVWSCTDQDMPKFKVKGAAHQSSGVKELRELSSAEIASKENALEFVEYACTENRLNQGISKLSEMGLEISLKSMSSFLKWVGNDILTEEENVLIKSEIARKDVMPRIADKARNWFINYIKTL